MRIVHVLGKEREELDMASMVPRRWARGALTLFVAICMVGGSVPLNAYAEEVDADNLASQETRVSQENADADQIPAEEALPDEASYTQGEGGDEQKTESASDEPMARESEAPTSEDEDGDDSDVTDESDASDEEESSTEDESVDALDVEVSEEVTEQEEGPALDVASEDDDIVLGDEDWEEDWEEYEEQGTYTIVFNANGGTGTMAKMTVSVDEWFALPICRFQRTGFRFEEWNTDKNGNGLSYCDTESVDGIANAGETITLYAQWSATTFTVVFKANGGTGTMAKASIDEGNFGLLPKCKFKRVGYAFVEWNTKANGGGISYADEDEVWGSAGETLTLYARWSAIKYSISYQLNGGKNNSGNPKAYKITSADITFAAPTRKGYTFGGWFSDAKLTKPVKAITKGSTGNKTLYAKWKEITYKVVYKLNGGKIGKKNPNSYKVTTAKKTLANPTRKGYTFGGWFGDAKLTQRVKTIGGGVIGNKTLYAKWTATKYKIVYKLKGGTNSKKNPSTYTITSKKISLAKPTCKGYTFGGWFSDAKLTKRVKAIAKGSTGKKILYAKWTANKYTIVYDGNGATSGQMASQSGRAYGKTYKLKGIAFKREGKYFNGWNTKRNGSGTWYKNKASVKSLTAAKNGKVVLYAQWEGEVGITHGDTDYGAVAIIRNHSNRNLRITAKFLYYRGPTLVANRSKDCYCLQGGGQCALQGWIHDVDYSSYKVQVTYEDASESIISNASQISASSNFGDQNVQVTVRNNGTSAEHTQIAVVFYRKGRIVGYDYGYAEVDHPGATDYLEFHFPHSRDYETITPTSYRVFVNESYRYD